MDNCDLEKLSVSAGSLHPDFTPEVTDYTVTVESGVDAVTVDVVTSDCAASHYMLSGDGSSLISLSDGLNRVDVEVVAEDGTLKTYRVDITRLSAKVSQLRALTVDGDVLLHPAFTSNVYEYKSEWRHSGIVPFHCEAVTLCPEVQDRRITVTVNGTDASRRVPVNFGDTALQISVRSADGSNSQVYTVLVTRELVPLPVTFTDGKQQLDYECPVSLSAFYRPVSISHSDPKQTLSRPYSEMLARRPRVDPLSACPLGDGWKVVERDLDGEMSAAPVKCFFVYRGKAVEGLSGAQLLWRKGSSWFVLKVRGWGDCLKLEREEEGNCLQDTAQ
ncbi:uncharacterized protein LOC133966543 [Platichthys flesus]|uniref:uncharacterized protein LOC133966543 n=1 Tax=Platichthys flesus TaxID=8260 RepID=UPI002DBC59E6|nr:uncharacterized protein LOC133966543 [Platichthys flesus]